MGPSAPDLHDDEVSSQPRPLPEDHDAFAFPVLPDVEPSDRRWEPTQEVTFAFPDKHVADSSWETLQHPCKLRPVHCAH